MDDTSRKPVGEDGGCEPQDTDVLAGGCRSAPQSQRKTTPLYARTREPNANEERWQAEQRIFWSRQLCVGTWLNWITASTVAVAAVGLVFLYRTEIDTRTAAMVAEKQAQIALDTLHSQRAYISFGSPDGKFAKYLEPKRGQKKGAIILHFQNSGVVAASHVQVQAYANNAPRVTFNSTRLLRYVMEYPKGFEGVMSAGGGDIAAHTPFDQPLDQKWVPTPNRWKQIRGDKWPGRFSVEGIFEYCDNWGQYHCERFSADYRPPPIDNFVAVPAMPCIVAPPSIEELPPVNRQHFVRFLPRCEQPGEPNLYRTPN
jgi:hypothetical protein